MFRATLFDGFTVDRYSDKDRIRFFKNKDPGKHGGCLYVEKNGADGDCVYRKIFVSVFVNETSYETGHSLSYDIKVNITDRASRSGDARRTAEAFVARKIVLFQTGEVQFILPNSETYTIGGKYDTATSRYIPRLPQTPGDSDVSARGVSPSDLMV